MKPVYGIHRDTHGVASVVFVHQPVDCACGRVALILLNRDGQTRCVDCDTKYTAGKEQSRE